MNLKSFLLPAAAVGLLALGGNAAATIVNIGSTLIDGVNQSFDAGSYTISLVGTSTPGALYDAWNPWGNNIVSNCGPNGDNCDQGWFDHFGFRSTALAGGGAYIAHADVFFSTPAQSLAAYQAGGLLAAPMNTDIGNIANYTALTGPITFTLAATTTINFFVGDSFYADNYGGVSLNVTANVAPGVPEPSTWAMLLMGFGGLGLFGLRASRKGAVTA